MQVKYSEKDGLMTAVITDNKGLFLDSKSTSVKEEMADFLSFAVQEYHTVSYDEAREKIEEYILDETHRLEDFTDIEQCSEDDHYDAVDAMQKTLNGYSEEEIFELYEAIFVNNLFEEFILNGWKDRKGVCCPNSVYPKEIDLGTFTFTVKKLNGVYKVSSEHDGNFDGDTDVTTTKMAGELFADFIETIEEGLM